MYQYNRVAEITLGRPGTVGRVFSGLHVAFNFKKTSTPEVNPGTLKIYNLSPETRRAIHELETVCVVRVGYDEALGPVEIFSGYVVSASSPREGANLVTTLELRDGYQELMAARFNKSYAKNVSLRTIVKDVVASLKLPVAVQSRLEAVADKKLGRGWSFNGASRQALDELSRYAGVTWSVQSGQVKILRAGEVDRQLSMVLSPTTGLLGRPTRLSEETKDGDVKKRVLGWRLTTLLSPTIEPGNAVQVDCDEVQGVFKVDAIEHSGELMGRDWTSTIEVVERE
jgi:hypothetical protein